MTDVEDRMGSPWGTHVVPEEGETSIDIGPLRLRVREHAGEVQLAHRLVRDGEASEPPEDLEWSRFAPRDWNRELTVRPAFPDRPVIVAPDDPFRLLAGAEARVYVRLPLFAAVQIEGPDAPTTLARLGTYPWSDTWWGTPTEGELCYWLTTHARRALRDDLFSPHLAVCPLQLVNRSEGDLDVEKIALRVVFLSLYRAGRHHWADEVRVRYQGEAEGSTLRVAGTPPEEAPDAELVLPPGQRMGRGFRARTFARLRSLQPWG